MARLYRGGRISQMLMEKEKTDEALSVVDRTDWYVPREDLLTPQSIDLFHLSFFDRSTQDFLDSSFAVSNSICLQIWYALASTFLSLFVSKTSSNGLLNRGGMLIFSTQQLREFLHLPVEWDRRGKRLLDLGAGDGGVTARAGDLFEHIHATEMSSIMQWRLRERGFSVLEVDDWNRQQSNQQFDLITVLNLLDRHYNPSVLLSQLHEVSSRNGCLVMMAIVLPIRQYVEFHPNGSTTRPDSWIAVEGKTFEEQVSSLIAKTFEPAGFEVIRWTRLPYLCEGDFQKPYYLLNDAVFLLRPLASNQSLLHPPSPPQPNHRHKTRKNSNRLINFVDIFEF